MSFLSKIASDLNLLLRRPARLQFAALCYRCDAENGALSIMLITSRDTGRWVIPKGWPMEGREAHETAAREAFEEAGAIGRAESEPLGHYNYLKKMKAGHEIECRVQVHALEVESFAEEFPEKGQRRLAWFSPDDAACRVAEPGLQKLISHFGRDETQRLSA